MAGELVETSRLWARDVAKIQPAWVEKLAANLLKHSYSEPVWSTKRAAAMVHQKSMLYGVTIIADRLIPYHRVDREAARDMFIRHGLIGGEWNTHHKFLKHNQQMLEEASAVEDKVRRRGLVVDEDTLFEFYDSRLPDNAVTGRTSIRGGRRSVTIRRISLTLIPRSFSTRSTRPVRTHNSPTTGARVQ